MYNKDVTVEYYMQKSVFIFIVDHEQVLITVCFVKLVY